jgi:1,5-anhydro-D-fructose reductase (1,5-anhydro-D-mannitol-forming)
MAYRIGIIGLGTIGQRMLANVADNDQFEVIAGWDPDAAACDEVKAAFPAIDIAGGADAVISNTDVDVVYIGCPPAYHKGYVDRCLATGRAMLCEKPLAVDLDEAAAMAAAVNATDVPAAVNFVHASAAAVDGIDQALSSGRVGTPQRIDIRVHFARWPRDWQVRADWLRYRKQGGFVREVVSHFVFMTQRLFGELELIDAAVGYPADPLLCESHILSQLDAGGIPVTIAAGAGGVGPDLVEFTVWGDQRSYRVKDWFELLESDGGPWQNSLPEIADARNAAMQHQLRNLACLLGGDAHTMASFDEALAVQQLIEAMLADA